MSQTNRRRKPAHDKPLRLQSLSRFLLRIGMGVLVIAVLAGGGRWLNQAMTVNTWKIHGVSEALELAVEKQLEAMRPLDLVDAWPPRLRKQLLANVPDIAELNITRQLPDKLEIQATARVPMALWQDAEGGVLLVDGYGTAYRALRTGEALDLPLLRVSKAELAESMSLLVALKQEDAVRYAHLSEWMAEPQGWRLNFERGRCWRLPRGAQAMPRMQGVLALMHDKRWKNGDWRIDARVGSRWFIRKSKSGGMV